ncbi:hypothetical protein CLOM_g404, partial [Closterium sp. NIES-68]
LPQYPAIRVILRVDITLVSQEVDRTVTYIKHRYVEYGETFGAGLSKRLSKFLQSYDENGGKVVVHGADDDGRPVSHSFKLVESSLPGHKYGGTKAACITLCTAFAEDTVQNLNQRMWDLKRMAGSKLYKVDTWPKKQDVRERRARTWVKSNLELFDNKLPGVDGRAAELELKTFCHIMKTHRADDDFGQGLANMLKTRDWAKSYPNLMRIWQAMAVLPLSTVECERGFSRQNAVKSWLRTSLCDARLGDLMTISLLEYDMDYPEIVEIWRRQKNRRQAKVVAYERSSDAAKGKEHDESEEDSGSCESASEGDEDEHGD